MKTSNVFNSNQQLCDLWGDSTNNTAQKTKSSSRMRLYFKSGGTEWEKEGGEYIYRTNREILFGDAVDIDLNDPDNAKRTLLERGKDSYTGAKFYDAATKTPRRSNNNVVELHTILADVDGGWRMENFIEEFKDVKFVLLPSKSHLRGKKHKNGIIDPPSHCFHALFPLDKPVIGTAEAKTVNDFIKQLLVEHGDFHFDGNAKDVSRFFAGNPYYGEKPELKEYILINNGSIDIDKYVRKLLPAAKDEGGDLWADVPGFNVFNNGCPHELQYIVDSGRFTFHEMKEGNGFESAYFSFMGCPQDDHDICVSRKVKVDGSRSAWGKNAYVFSSVVKILTVMLFRQTQNSRLTLLF